MNPASAAHLACPGCRGELRLEVLDGDGVRVREGVLTCESCGVWYPIAAGVPRLVSGALRADHTAFARRHGLSPISTSPAAVEEAAGDVPAGDAAAAYDGVRRTLDSFSGKWDHVPQLGIGDPEKERFWDAWTASKLGFDSPEELYAFVSTRRRILDVGCGAGQKLRMMGTLSPGLMFGVDLSTAADHAYRNTCHLPNVTVVQADLFALPFPERSFDFVISDGVLHHTPDTRAAFQCVTPFVAEGGILAIHVYRQMNPIREFADDYLRARMTQMTPEACWEACKPITRLGQALSELDTEIEIPDDIPLLGFRAGRQNLQRFLYYEVLKCYWNDLFTFDENNQGVFDHYHPAYAHRHTVDEVQAWCDEAGLVDASVHLRTPNGISLTARVPPTQRSEGGAGSL